MIGSGVFTTSGFALESLGSPAAVLAAWAVGGLIASCGAIAYGALAFRLPQSGGEYLYLSRALHPFFGFLAGTVSLTAGFSGAIAFAALTCQAYAGPLVGLPDWLPPQAFATAVVIVCGIVHVEA
ncbi:MAG: amino acid permease, partial [Planctomycetia bacterium]|nr:amino acid permease [Planctomycetia bacterium]